MDKKGFSIIGERVPRIDAWEKVTGSAQYTDDLKAPQMLVGKIKRSPHAHARILSIETTQAEALSGVKAVIVGSDAPTPYGIMPQAPTEFALAVNKVRYAGEGVAAVAAVDEETALEALDLIKVEYEPLPAYLTTEEALRGDVPIHVDKKGRPFVYYEGRQSFGDVDAALSASAHVLEKRASTQYVTHAFLEPQSALAKFDGSGRLTLWSCTQIPHYLQRTISLVLGIPDKDVRVMFYCAAMLHLPYKVPNVRFYGKRVFTNKPTCGAMRGLGGVQPRIAVETALDEIALNLGMSPHELRWKNAVESGHTTASNMFIRHSEYKKCLDDVVKRSGYSERRGKLPFGRGVGLAGGHYSSGTAYTLYLSYKPHCDALIRVDPESGVSVYCGAAEIGQGSDTVLSMIAAETLGVPLSDVRIFSGDTGLTPFDLGSFSSRVTVAAGHAVKEAAVEVSKKLYGVAAVSLGVQGEHLTARDGKVFSKFESQKSMDFWEAVDRYNAAYGPLTATGSFTPPRRSAKGSVQGGNIGHSPTYGFTAHVAEVEVETETGEVRLLKMTEAGDCGQPINPIGVEGQVEGSIVMGMGQAFFDEMVVRGDRVLNTNLQEYRIPTMMDLPVIDTETVDSFDPDSPYGAKKCGEGPIQAVIPAILNAVYDAIGVRFTELPLTPEKVLAALRAKKAKEGIP
jgi:CO/xanthine dehydrogenase Mo-binding subunit